MESAGGEGGRRGGVESLPRTWEARWDSWLLASAWLSPAYCGLFVGDPEEGGYITPTFKQININK